MCQEGGPDGGGPLFAYLSKEDRLNGLVAQPWPWYVSGPLIGLTLPALLLSGKTFGISSNFQHLGPLCSPNTRIKYLRENDWCREVWNLLFVVGILIGAALGMHLLSNSPFLLLPEHYYNWGGIGKLLIGSASRSDLALATSMDALPAIRSPACPT